MIEISVSETELQRLQRKYSEFRRQGYPEQFDVFVQDLYLFGMLIKLREEGKSLEAVERVLRNMSEYTKQMLRVTGKLID